MKTSYQVVSPGDNRELSEFLAKQGRFLLPMLDLITRAIVAPLHPPRRGITVPLAHVC